MMEKKYLNLTEAAKFLEKSRPTVYSWIKKGTVVPAIHEPGIWLFELSHLQVVRAASIQKVGGVQ